MLELQTHLLSLIDDLEDLDKIFLTLEKSHYDMLLLFLRQGLCEALNLSIICANVYKLRNERLKHSILNRQTFEYNDLDLRSSNERRPLSM